MFDRLGRGIARHPKIIVLIWLAVTVTSLVLAMTGVGGQGLFDRLNSGEPRVAGSESDRGRDLIAQNAVAGEQLSLVVQGLDLTDAESLPEVARAMGVLHTNVLAVDGVGEVMDPFVLPGGVQDPMAVGLVSQAQDGFLVTVSLVRGLDDTTEETALGEVTGLLRGLPEHLGPEATGIVSGASLMTEAVVGQVERDLATGEIVALPISLLIMVIVFGGFLAAGIPLAGALASITGGLGGLLGFTYFIDLDSVVVNVVTVLGLGLSIDYGLLIVSRYREEIRAAVAEEVLAAEGTRSRRPRGKRADAAITMAMRRTMATAGRTITFSAVIVAISIAGLILFRPEILRSLGAAGVSVVVIALLSALTLVPALLALRGRRMMKPSTLARVPGLRVLIGKLGEVAPDHGFFSRLATVVQRRPWLVLLGVTAILLLFASPLLHLQMRNSTLELLPSDSDQRDFVSVIRADYPLAVSPAIEVLVEADAQGAQTFADQITALPDVLSVDPSTPIGQDYLLIGVRPDTPDAGGPLATQVVHDIRDLRGDTPDYWVIGQAANQLDFNGALVEGLPWAGGIVVLATFVLLFLMTGSLLVPLKALIINLLSLTASLGVTTSIFQEGHLSGLLNFTSAGGLESYVVAVVVAFGFGLAMDYEVFLIARIKEAYDLDHDNDAAVRTGLQRSGRIITSAALVIMVVFAGFVAGDLLVIKEVGVALAITVLIDATLVRMLLVPATMTLLGHWNWWAPKPLRRLHQRFAITH